MAKASTQPIGTAVRIIGILNATPDSYVDGGKYQTADAAVARAKAILSQGGDIIEIGGESTGPGSPSVSLEEELNRVIPLLIEIRSALPQAKICIDTWKSAVAEQALQSGVDMINDITAGRADPAMFEVISRARCPYIMMYAKDPSPRTTREDRQYDDVTTHIAAFLESRIADAVRHGIDRDRIIIDPGLGHFVSAKPEYSFEILNHLETFAAIAPVLVSPSRKSFLAGDPPVPVAQRLPATLAATTVAVLHGASFIRTHDVRETRLACTAASSLRLAKQLGHEHGHREA
jgi:dihydropteroate synthase